jgi:hypothetical protein
MANTVQLHSDRGASLRLLVITAILAMLAAGFVASVWRAPEPPPAKDVGEPSEPAQKPVALR